MTRWDGEVNPVSPQDINHEIGVGNPLTLRTSPLRASFKHCVSSHYLQLGFRPSFKPVDPVLVGRKSPLSGHLLIHSLGISSGSHLEILKGSGSEIGSAWSCYSKLVSTL